MTTVRFSSMNKISGKTTVYEPRVQAPAVEAQIPPAATRSHRTTLLLQGRRRPDAAAVARASDADTEKVRFGEARQHPSSPPVAAILQLSSMSPNTTIRAVRSARLEHCTYFICLILHNSSNAVIVSPWRHMAVLQPAPTSATVLLGMSPLQRCRRLRCFRPPNPPKEVTSSILPGGVAAHHGCPR